MTVWALEMMTAIRWRECLRLDAENSHSTETMVAGIDSDSHATQAITDLSGSIGYDKGVAACKGRGGHGRWPTKDYLSSGSLGRPVALYLLLVNMHNYSRVYTATLMPLFMFQCQRLRPPQREVCGVGTAPIPSRCLKTCASRRPQTVSPRELFVYSIAEVLHDNLVT